MHISLTPTLEQFVKSMVATGLYNNASEVVREALRGLYQKEQGSLSAQPAESFPPNKDTVTTILRQNQTTLQAMGVDSLYLFGSVLHGEARADSDIDLFFEPGSTNFSLLDLVAAKNALEEILRHKVDLLFKKGIDPLVKDKVIAEAERVF